MSSTLSLAIATPFIRCETCRVRLKMKHASANRSTFPYAGVMYTLSSRHFTTIEHPSCRICASRGRHPQKWVGHRSSTEAPARKQSAYHRQRNIGEQLMQNIAIPGTMNNIYNETRGRLARKHFSPGAHPAAETPFYIAAASVSARGDAQCVWSHESSISSSYERKHGSARSHIFTSVKTRRVKLVKLETNYKQKEEQSIAKLTRRPQFLAKHARAT